jgi:hypothetical protein
VFAAGADRVETLDAQLLAEDFLGDSIVSNIVAMGYAWQRGLVPIGLAAMRRAIELNGVAVENNLKAFSLGRLAAADPVACREMLHEPDPATLHADTVDELVERGVRHLTAYQDAGYAERYRALVAATRAAESALPGASTAEASLTRAVAVQMRRLMAYKDEYEVARLYTDGEFARRLADQFEGDFELEFYMAPPAFAKPKGSAPPRKVRLGGWLLPVLKVLAKGKVLRGTALDPFRSNRGAPARAQPDRFVRGAHPRPARRTDAGAPRRRDGDRQRAARHPRLRPRQARQPRDRTGARERIAAPLRPGALSAPVRRSHGRAVPRHSGQCGVSPAALLHFCACSQPARSHAGRRTGEPGLGGARRHAPEPAPLLLTRIGRRPARTDSTGGRATLNVNDLCGPDVRPPACGGPTA